MPSAATSGKQNTEGSPPQQHASVHRETGRYRLLGLPVDAVDMLATLAWMVSCIEEYRRTREAAQCLATDAQGQRTRQVVTLNPEMVMAARHNAELCAAISEAELVVPDGIGIVWAARLRGWARATRVSGVDLLEAFADLASRRGYRVFLLGARAGVAEEAAEWLSRRCPDVIIAGTYGGSPALEDEADVLRRIHAAQPDAVFVAFGSPAQECWIARNRARLGAAVAVGVGGALDFIAGRVPRAPGWIQRAGFEWSYRLWREPWRWRRMLALPRFVFAVAVETAMGAAGSKRGVGAHRGRC